MTEPDRLLLAPLIAMVKLLRPEAIWELAHALHAKQNAPPTPAERRVKMLGLLMRVLEEQPQPPDRLPYVARKRYDAVRATNPSLGPPSAKLQEQF
jgi:hypothetical protein